MQEFLAILFCLAGTLSVAFGLAWIIPLVTAPDPTAKPLGETTLAQEGIDFFLRVAGLLPFFGLRRLFRSFRNLPSFGRAARKRWREEKAVRLCFGAFLISGLAMAVIWSFLGL